MKVVATKKAPEALGPYSQGYVHNGIFYSAGQVPSFDKVLKTTCFLADMGDFAAFNEVYAKYFTSKPARSCVAVKTLPKNVKCEVELIAVAEER